MVFQQQRSVLRSPNRGQVTLNRRAHDRSRRTPTSAQRRAARSAADPVLGRGGGWRGRGRRRDHGRAERSGSAGAVLLIAAGGGGHGAVLLDVARRRARARRVSRARRDRSFGAAGGARRIRADRCARRSGADHRSRSSRRWSANSAYLAIAEAAGVLGESDRPPMMSRLFGADPMLSAPMFRLSKAAQPGQTRREELPATGGAQPASLRATKPASGRCRAGDVLWRLREIGAGEATARRRGCAQLFLDDAPIGFFAARARRRDRLHEPGAARGAGRGRRSYAAAGEGYRQGRCLAACCGATGAALARRARASR